MMSIHVLLCVVCCVSVFFFKQKTAYEMRISDWSSDVCSSDLTDAAAPRAVADRVFDAFDKGGAGPLAAWIILSGDVEQLEPVRAAVRALVEAIVGQSTDEAEIGRAHV